MIRLRCFYTSHPSVVLDQGWSPPPRDWIKVNCDVRVRQGDMCAYVVAGNHLGKLSRVVTKRFQFFDHLQGEAEACLLALETAVKHDNSYVMVESDYEATINALNRVTFR
uniref:RNase H type-1 domain-containing protein n=1 Tax=Cannabis sativa TaxID=3483 RepID=A0A803QC46_CANSA